MRVYVCVDDTDDLTKSTSTGTISELIAKAVVELGGKMEHGITRHQLLLHEDIDYTSHNSSMCFVADIEGVEIEQIKAEAEKILLANMAETSDPGLCFCRLDQLKKPEKLIAYGKRAQNEVIQKEEAYALAKEIGGTILEEYGGTGIGVIGALAGVGLRLSGCDGTFRGKSGEEYAGETHTAAQWKKLLNLDQVLDIKGNMIPDDVEIELEKQAKMMFLEHKVTMIVMKKKDKYVVCRKKELYDGDKRVNEWTTSCTKFEFDNDVEEQLGEAENACYNCLFRRWTAEGYRCVKQGE